MSVFDYIFIMYIIPSIIFSIIFSSFIWMILSNRYKKSYKDDFSLWEKREIQKSLYEHRNRVYLSEDSKQQGNINLLIAKWDAIADIESSQED